MRWLLVYFLILNLTNPTNAVCQTADFSKGKWFKIATTQKAIYQITGTQLKQMGIAIPISSNKLQLFGFDLTQLAEKVPANVPVGNQEISIMVKDGGDGVFNENDQFLFYAPGNIDWGKWGEGLQWKHKNMYQVLFLNQ